MAWYRTGTASFTNGSTNVTGTGTDWTVGASNGDALQAPDGRAYEIAAVVSATQLTLAANYLGASASGQSYAISPTQSFVRDLADQVSTLVLDYGSVKSTVAAGKFPDGTAITPGMRFTSDEDTGFRRTASGTVAIVTNGTDKVVVSPSGVTGITKADVGLGNVDNTSNATERAATATLTNKTINLSNNTLVMTSAQLAAALTDETGTGSAVFSVSPALTGTPTAPTAAAGTNTTQLATTAFVVGQAATTAPVNTGLQVLGTSNRYAREDHAHAALDIALRAPIAPTLDLNFAKGYGEVYNPTTGRMERLSAWSDLITFNAVAERCYTDAKGLLVKQTSGQPRITYDPVTGAGRGLSVWGQRANLLTYSERFEITHQLTVTGGAGTFTDGETVTATGGGTGTYSSSASTASLFGIAGGSGSFSGTLTGATSAATRTISSLVLVWSKTAATVTANTTATSVPDGTVTAELLAEDTTTSNHEIFQSFTPTALTTYTLSCYVKAAGSTTGAIRFSAGLTGAGVICSFDLTAKTATVTSGSGTADITQMPNGWFRVSLSATASASPSTTYQYISRSISTLGSIGNSLYIWGAQLEAGSTASPYIPTTTGQITANADTATITGSNFSKWFNQSEGTFVAIMTSAATAGAFYLSVNDNTANNRISLQKEVTGGDRLMVLGNTAGVGLVITPVSTTAHIPSARNIAALTYSGTNRTICLNAATPVSATTYATPVVTQLQIGNQLTSAQTDGTIERILYFPRALPSNLQALSA